MFQNWSRVRESDLEGSGILSISLRVGSHGRSNELYKIAFRYEILGENPLLFKGKFNLKHCIKISAILYSIFTKFKFFTVFDFLFHTLPSYGPDLENAKIIKKQILSVHSC